MLKKRFGAFDIGLARLKHRLVLIDNRLIQLGIDEGQQIAFLDHGKLVLTGNPQDVFRKPRHPRLEQFLDTYLDRGAAMLV